MKKLKDQDRIVEDFPLETIKVLPKKKKKDPRLLIVEECIKKEAYKEGVKLAEVLLENEDVKLQALEALVKLNLLQMKKRFGKKIYASCVMHAEELERQTRSPESRHFLAVAHLRRLAAVRVPSERPAVRDQILKYLEKEDPLLKILEIEPLHLLEVRSVIERTCEV